VRVSHNMRRPYAKHGSVLFSSYAAARCDARSHASPYGADAHATADAEVHTQGC